MLFSVHTFPYTFSATVITIDSVGYAAIGGTWSSTVCTLSSDYTLPFAYQIVIPAATEISITATLTDNGEIFTNTGANTQSPGGTLTIQENGLVLDYNGLA